MRDGYSTLEEFTTSLAALGELRDRGQLRVRVPNERQVIFAIDRSAGYVPPQDGSYLDILDVLSAIAFGEAIDDFAARRAAANGDSGAAERERDVWEAKFQAAAAAFPRSELRPGALTRARASVRWALTSAVIGGAKRSGLLGKLMYRTRFRRLIGARGRREAWRELGARIADTVLISPGVTLRLPQNVTIGAGTKVGGRVRIESFARVDIGRNVLLNDTDIYSTQHHLDHPRFLADHQPVKIGDYAWLPYKIIVLPGVHIGNYAVVGTGSVVSRDVPDYGVAVGNPARVVKERARIHYTYTPISSGRPPSIV